MYLGKEREVLKGWEKKENLRNRKRIIIIKNEKLKEASSNF